MLTTNESKDIIAFPLFEIPPKKELHIQIPEETDMVHIISSTGKLYVGINVSPMHNLRTNIGYVCGYDIEYFLPIETFPIETKTLSIFNNNNHLCKFRLNFII